MKKLALSLLLASITSLSAAEAMATTTAPKSNFGGFYWGVQTGLAQNATSVRETTAIVYGPQFLTESSKASIGLRVGQDFVEESQIYGYFAEGSLSALDSQREIFLGSPWYSVGSQISMLGSVQGKYGVVSDKLAVFGTAGVAFCDAKNKFNYTATNNNEFDESYFDTAGDKIGYVLGVGAAYAVDQQSSFSVDLMQYRFGPKTSTLLQSDGTPLTEPSTWNMQDRITTLKVSYNIRF